MFPIARGSRHRIVPFSLAGAFSAIR